MEGAIYVHRMPSRPLFSVENGSPHVFGCGFDWLLNRVFFTYNGTILNQDFPYGESVIFPTICFKNSIYDLFITFNPSSFKFDINSYLIVLGLRCFDFVDLKYDHKRQASFVPSSHGSR